MFNKLFDLKPVTLSILALLIIIAGVFFILSKNKKNLKFDTRIIVYGSLCIALSFILSYIRLYRFPQGGSITPASMLPMFIFAVMFGPLAGIIAGFAFGLLKLIQDPYIIHWAQFFLDYPLAYGALGLAGLYRKNISISCFIGGFGRFFMSFLSGVIFFGSYAPDGMNVLFYSLSVNGLIIGTDTLICIIISLLPQIKSAITRIQSGNLTH
ncbi:energy-coupled thiamine transporter ThiT [Alkaliphilus peptidifermentans]|uniref:Thiamine transporter n=1 Tax=Alkaliphilus peptidifermentans DSM 18978 TaxID=1120976 RepID=A0A1G5KPB6_9FIRM|nr:energy-coupled thiamine transporter ThiT [Alkaliphilus peptidifermentans]SCZ02194.1 thiamine transporter [Alkaliphilus peptidifermentans DSM 18978]